MSFFRPKGAPRRNYDLYKGYSYYTPGIKGMFALLGMLLIGMLLGAIVTMILMPILGQKAFMAYGNLVIYPLQFVPPMIYASVKSKRNALFEDGWKLNSRNFGKWSPLSLVAIVIIMTLALAFASDIVNYTNYKLTTRTPGMARFYDMISEAMKSMTGGPVWASILLVGIMAPVFEEWLCRGEVLRGLLRKVKPVWAIVISALFFAAIHGNPWQALNAFLIGCVLGYVYYKTGSLILTMIIHATNNTAAVVLANIDSLKDVDYFIDIMDKTTYGIFILISLVIVAAALMVFKGIPLRYPKGGNIDPEESIEILPEA